MATLENLEFVLGEDWDIELDCTDSDSHALDLTGAGVLFRIFNRRGQTETSVDQNAGISVNSPATDGKAFITINPAAQAGLRPDVYRYEAVVTLASGAVSIQAYGSFHARST